MTLRGQIADFPIETVVQLLASTGKTGQLEVRGDGQSGSLGFDGGRLVSAAAGDDIGEPALGAVFTLNGGDFEFIPWSDAPVANLFVAGFIGSPAMNFFPAEVKGTAQAPVVDAGFVQIPLDPRAGLTVGRAVIVGIRPEDIDAGDAAREDHLPVDARVDVVEFLGNEYQLHLSSDGKPYVARVDTRVHTQPGADLRVGFDKRKIHIFDKETGEAVA